MFSEKHQAMSHRDGGGGALGQAADMTDPAPEDVTGRRGRPGTGRPAPGRAPAGDGRAKPARQARQARSRAEHARGAGAASILPGVLSTASVFPERTTDAFALAARHG